MDPNHSYRYTAFLSYSHRDNGWASRIHRALERFRIDDRLRERATFIGPDPGSLRPVFRDREDFSAGESLDRQTREALEASAFLILLCSPSAAQSEYVNQEVLLFKQLGRGERIIPVILDGEPDSPEVECFPPAMRYRVTKTGRLSKKKEDIIAADVRSTGDGWTLTLAKIVARMIGVGTDEVFARAERERRNRLRIRAIIGLVIAALATGGAIFAYKSHSQQQTLTEIETLVSKYSIVSPAQGATTTSTEQLTDAITAIVTGAARDKRYARALRSLKDGKVEQAEELLRVLAEETAKRVDTESKRAAEAYRRLGAIAGLGDPKRAREAYAKALQYDPSDSDALYWHGWLSLLAGNLTAAEKELNRLLEISKEKGDGRGVFRAHLRLGELARDRGNLDAALKHQTSANRIASADAKATPGDVERQRDLSVSSEKLGDIFYSTGDIGKALVYYRKGLKISKSLAENDRKNPQLQRDLSVLLERVGDVLVAQDKIDEAVDSYRQSATIRKGLAALAPDNESWQRDHSVALERLGDALHFKGEQAEALASYRKSLAISEKLATRDTENAGRQYDLAISATKVGDMLRISGKLDDALSLYKQSRNICEKLVKDQPTNAKWNRALSVAFVKVGDVLAEKKKTSEALKSYEQALRIREKLVKSDQSNAVWQRDLAVIYSKFASAYQSTGDRDRAIEALEKGKDIIGGLVQHAPGNAAWRRDFEWFEERISELRN
ncbi:MAG: TIR domain-containing protein [Hyphomicrobiaceae bacterium]|nr:TIR domain-containing protein [Hyphomicrobiaceae bacterium]